METLKMYTVEEHDLKYLKEATLSERVKWMREKANEYNPPLFSPYRLAEGVGVPQSTISRIEAGTLPKVELLDNIAVQLGVSVAVFTDSYYINGGEPFTICENGDNSPPHTSSRSFNLLDSQYEAKLSLSLKTHEGTDYASIEETVFLSPLEQEEFVDEVNALISKVRSRRKNWKIQQAALNKLTGRKENEV